MLLGGVPTDVLDWRWIFFINVPLGLLALSQAPLSIVIVIAANGASQLVTRLGVKPIVLGGLAFTAAGMAWFSQIDAGGSFVADALGPSTVTGIGFGAVFVSVTIAGLADAGPTDAGLASGLINTTQQIGGALGLAILATLANDQTAGRLRDGVAAHPALVDGFGRAFAIATVITILAGLLAAITLTPTPARTRAP